MPGGPAWIHDYQSWLRIGCGAVVIEVLLRLLPLRHPPRAGNARLAPKLSRGGRTAIRGVLLTLALFWLATDCLLTAVTLRAIEDAALKPVRIRPHRGDFPRRA